MGGSFIFFGGGMRGARLGEIFGLMALVLFEVVGFGLDRLVC